ncbi:MAG: hypothetical protein RMJ36_03415 [Candidatus Calescibacterium sp.]|nr:hypothetical protein [Candidatus Calescibacterium sp.]MDW8132685.1 hypothetical protein [Candidatus Calescibacterium sp.]
MDSLCYTCLDTIRKRISLKVLPGYVFQKSLKEVHFSNLYFLFLYDELYDFIRLYKFENRIDLINHIVMLIMDVVGDDILRDIDIITFVPNHNKLNNFLITLFLANQFNIVFKEVVSINPKNLVLQHLIKDKKSRIENAKNKFVLKNGINLANVKKVVVFDDICTTGSSLNEVCRMIRTLNKNILINCMVLAKA